MDTIETLIERVQHLEQVIETILTTVNNHEARLCELEDTATTKEGI